LLEVELAYKLSIALNMSSVISTALLFLVYKELEGSVLEEVNEVGVVIFGWIINSKRYTTKTRTFG